MKLHSFLKTSAARLCLLGLLWPAVASAHTSEEILSLAVTNYTGYVIDSDGNFPSTVYNRDTIDVSAQVSFTTTGVIASTYEYQMQFRLVDSQGQAVLLKLGPGQTGTTYIASDSVTLPFVVFGVPTQTTTRKYGAALKPATRLDPYDQYHVELVLAERPGGSNVRHASTGDEMSTPPQTYHHFQNTTSGDAALNVIATLDSVEFARVYAVKTIPAKNSFTVTAAYHLRRYDDFYTQPANASVSVHFSYELVDASTGLAVPLAVSNAVVTRSIASFVLGTPYKPAVVSASDTLDLEPAAGVQLDSVNHSYFARVTVSHVDEAGQPPEPGNQVPSADERLLHFNGDLYFGPIQTRFTSIDNVPDSGLVVPNSHVLTHLGVNNNSGYIVGKPSHTYGDGTDLSVRLLPSGSASLVSGSVAVNEPNPDTDTAAHVKFERQNILLNATGARADVTMTLPAGFGYRGNMSGRRLNSKISWASVSLNQALAPAADLTYDTPHFACEESKPFWIGSSSLVWQIASGRFLLTPTGVHYVRSVELATLEATPGLVEPDMKLKRSNEQYHRYLQNVTSSQVVVQADNAGHAQMTLDVSVAPGRFTAHFPYDAPVEWLGNGQMKIVADRVAPASSSLSGVKGITNRYDQDCPGCGPGVGRADLTFLASGNELRFTVDGGLDAPGLLAAPQPLNWGWIGVPAIQKFAQRTTPWSEGSFLMAGCFLRGDQTPFPASDRAGVLLLSGALPGDLAIVERPGTPAYLNGAADYAGLNFRVGTNGLVQAESVIAGKETGLYDLTGRSKYYARWSGVSGIHEAVPGTFPLHLTLYGYDFTFLNYGLSYLDSRNEDSRTEGTVYIKLPSNFYQNFNELTFSCVGALESAKIPSNEAGAYKLLEYWNGDFITLAIRFDRDQGAACDPSVGYLVLGVQGHANYVQQPLFGSLGFKSNGNLISSKDVTSGEIQLEPGFNSRLKTPNNFQIQGPQEELYTLNPVTDAYYNDWETRDTSEAQGFVNLAADLDVPFFKNIKAHVHTSGKTNSPAPIFLMGGWPDHGYGTAADNFFTNPDFDEDNTGYPTTVAVAYYRDSAEEKYHPRAQTSWLGVIDLDYPLTWRPAVRWFQSWQPVGSDLLVMSIEHKVKYLSAQNAELTFGSKVEIGGTLSPGVAFKLIDGEFGVLEAFQAAGFETNQANMKSGFEAMDEMLTTDPNRFFDEAITQNIPELAFMFYQDIKNGPGTVTTYLDNYFDPVAGPFLYRLRHLDTAPNGIIERLRFNLDHAILAVDSVRAIIAKPDGSNREAATVLLAQLLKEADQEFVKVVLDALGDTLNEQLDTYLDAYDSSFDQIDVILAGLGAQLVAIRAKLNDGGEFQQEIHDLFVERDSDLQDVVNRVRQDMIDFFLQHAGEPIESIGQGLIVDTMMQKLRDRFSATALAAHIQVPMRQRLYDVDAAVREAADTEFALLDASLRTLVDEVLTWVDKKFRKLLGKLDALGGATQVKGYAHINGDSLKLLRLDVAAQLNLPDAMEFAAYFQIKELDSDGTPTECLPLSGRATEVTLGAVDIPLNYTGSTNNSLKATVSTKFTFDPGPANDPYPLPLLINLGGMIELKGSLTFGTLEIKYVSAGMSFGEFENYITAAATVRQGGYEGTGGIFIGRTCTLGFLYWDPDVTAVLGTQLPFSGMYVYGEVWIPIAEVILGIPSSCMFDVSAGVGAGMGMFFEGPTFVAKMKMGVSGSVLCLLSVKGEVALAGKANPDGVALAGRGTLSGVIGKCDFCLDFSKDLFMTYENASWDLKF